ncbi:sigma factor, partial [Lentibacillus jeotgali]|uniref:sigma factor n=1 Tax=Lentibacillus jeotgali TaxID=558169 RepID=UPI0002627419
MKEINHRVVQRIKKGDNKAFGIGKLIDFYKHNVYQICFAGINDGCIAESVAKDIFLYVYYNIEDYDMDKKFSSWLYRITVNKMMDCLNEKDKDF